MKSVLIVICLLPVIVTAQEAESGFELAATVTAASSYSHRLSERPRFGAPLVAGFRSMLYPTWKLGRNWTISGAVQAHSRPYFTEQFSTQGNGVKVDILQAHLGYAKFWQNRSLVVRVGQLSSAFGSFLLRYDDAVNPLIDMPSSYGYYYKAVTNLGLAGAQVDGTWNRLDARLQYVNSSPANRRSIFDRDQYGSWAGGIGYTIVQGLRVGASAYNGPYLHRQHRYYSAGEANPRDLPARAKGIDVQWSRGHWTANGEAQWFARTYKAMPNYYEQAQYGEFRRVLHPRWYTAARFGFAQSSVSGPKRTIEAAIGFRPNRLQLIKLGYLMPYGQGALSNVLGVQIVTSLRGL